MMGFASLHARSAAPLSTMVTCWQNHSIALINITLINLLYITACESFCAQSGLEWSQRECTDEATDRAGRPWGSCCPCLSLNDSIIFLLNAWGDTDSTSWRQKSSWFKASSVGGRFFFFFFFSDWAERMRYRNLPWGSEFKSGQIGEGVVKVTAHRRSNYTQYMRKTTSPSSRNGTLKAKLPRLLSFRSIRRPTLMQTEAADGLRSLRFKKLLRKKLKEQFTQKGKSTLTPVENQVKVRSPHSPKQLK